MLRSWVLPLCMFMSGYCGIVAELSLFQLAESLLGNTITNLLYTMGVMMFFMGIGAWVANGRIMKKATMNGFIFLEIGLSFAVSSTIPLITYLAGVSVVSPLFIFILFSAFIGCFIGMEIPIMQKLIHEETKEDIQKISSSVMMADYFGSLVGFAAFSLVLLYTLGLASSNLSAGAANLLSASLIFVFYRQKVSVLAKAVIVFAVFVITSLGLNIHSIMDKAEQNLYAHKIIWSKQTPYQKIILTDNSKEGNPKYDELHSNRYKLQYKEVDSFKIGANVLEVYQDKRDAYSLYLNGGLQFNTYDEAFYHEFLVHPALSLIENPRSVLVLGGGDGMGIREILKHKSLDKIVLVDLDEQMLKAFKESPLLQKFNAGALNNKRVEIIADDAWNYVRNTPQKFDCIIADFPDPHHSATAKLYTAQFYKLVKRNLEEKGIFITQSSSPLLDNKAFLCIRKTLLDSGFNVLSCHIEMESFFQWGFQICSVSMQEKEMKSRLSNIDINVETDFLNRDTVKASWLWPKNFYRHYPEIPVNDLMSLKLLQMYHSKR